MDPKWTLSLLAAILHTVASAPESVFALEGNSVTLIMQSHNNISNVTNILDVSWIFNQSCDFVTYYPHYDESRQLRITEPFKGRVEFDNTTFSLELTNLQKNDSGLYKGEIHADWGNAVSEYRLNVLDVTICNHSNPVSWHHATVELETLCQSTQHKKHHFNLDDKQTPIWICVTVASGLVLLVLILCGFLCFRMHSKNQAGSSSNVYQSVENVLVLSPVKSPSPIYCKVQSHTGPNTDLETPQPEHVYSFVSLPDTGVDVTTPSAN